MTVEIKEIHRRSNVETAEDDLPSNLRKTDVHSEIDYLKRLRLKAQINGQERSNLSISEKAIASFKSKEDARIEEFYHALIIKYNIANGISKSDGTAFAYTDGVMNADDAKIMYTGKTELAYLYSLYGYKNRYSLAHDMAEIERVQNSNQEIKDSSKYVLGVETKIARAV